MNQKCTKICHQKVGGGNTDLKPGVPPGDLPSRGAGGPRPGGG